MPKFAMRLTEEFFGIIEQFTGESSELAKEVFSNTPYLVLTMITETEFNLKLTTEEQMLDAYKDDPELRIVS